MELNGTRDYFHKMSYFFPLLNYLQSRKSEVLCTMKIDLLKFHENDYLKTNHDLTENSRMNKIS